MKRILLIPFLFVFSIGFAQVKVVERSSKKVPKWLNGLEKDYIIVVGSSANIQDAQQNALNLVKEQIVSSVAENVKTSSEMRMEESTINNISTYLENFATTTTTTSGPVPFLQGISLSKVEEYYWEKLENRSDRSVTYNYHIKYPFPYIELWKLVDEFKKRDREMTEQLDALLDAVDRVASTEEIDRSLDELKVLSDYFMDARKDKVTMAMTQYRALYNMIELVELTGELGALKYVLRIGDRTLTSTKRPQVKSECARILGSKTENGYMVVNYDYENCYDDPENHILISYRFGNNTIRKPFYFDITGDKASISVNEPFHFKALSSNHQTVEQSVIDMVLVSKYDSPFAVDKVVIELPSQSPMVIENIGQTFQGRGNHSLKLTHSGSIDKSKTSSQNKRVSMLSGVIHYRSTKTNEVKTYRISNHTYTTDW